MKTLSHAWSRRLMYCLVGISVSACGNNASENSSSTQPSSTLPDTTTDTATQAANVVDADQATLSLGLSSTDSLTQVTQNIVLATSGVMGSTINWSSSHTDIVTHNGLVTRPDSSQTDQVVILTATLTYQQAIRQKTFTLTVVKQPLTDLQIVTGDHGKLTLILAPNDSLSRISQNVTLATRGNMGSTISWSSSNTNVVSHYGLVTRPDFSQSDENVTLTATLSHHDAYLQKTFKVIVAKQSPSDQQVVTSDQEDLTLTFSANDSLSHITQDIAFPTSGAMGSTISWSSSDTSVVSHDGHVTRPDSSQSDKVVTLTARLTHNNSNLEKFFSLTVIKQSRTDLQNVTSDRDNLSVIVAPGDSLSAITQHITLPTSGDLGSTISWVSNNPDIISHSGVVNRSGHLDTLVTLTATLQHNTQSLTRIFTLTVVKVSGVFYALCEGDWPTMLPEPGDEIESWVVTPEGGTESSVFWNPLKNQSLHYRPVVQPAAWSSGLTLDTYGKSETILRYNAEKPNSLSYHSGAENYSIIESGQFDDGKVVTIHYAGMDANDQLIGQSAALNFTIGQSHLDRPRFLLGERTAEPGQINLTWCPVSSASAYTLYYGDNPHNLIQQQDLGNTQRLSLSDMPSDQNVYFRVQATNAKGEGRLSRRLTVAPTATEMGNFSIDQLTLNQGVQIDLMNNSNNTPAIANKPGVLRVFVNASQISDVKNLQVSLHGKRQNTPLEPIVREVPLQHTPFGTHDSNSLPVVFTLKDADWLSSDSQFYVTIDSNNRINESDETDNRYPLAGYQSFNFQNTTPLTIKLVPTITASGTTVISAEFITQLENWLLAMYPISNIVIQQGDALDLSACDMTVFEGWSCALDKLQIYRIISVDGNSSQNDVFYYGLIAKPESSTSPSGLGSVTVLINDELASSPDALNAIGLEGDLSTAAHEISHNQGRNHVGNKDEDDNQDIDNDVCATPGSVDENYPYNSEGAEYGRIGVTGFHHGKQQFYEKSWYHDVMSYCNKQWISDYTYKALHDFSRSLDRQFSHREKANNAYIQKTEHRQKGLTITGRTRNDQWEISHILSVNGTPQRPQKLGRYQLFATNLNDENFQEIFHPHHYDHIKESGFNLFIPSSSPLKYIQITDLKDKKTIFKKILGQ